MENIENKEKKIYNYYKSSIHMEMLMDNNCSQVWNVLKGLSFFNRDNTFNVTSKYLETVTGLSKKVINAVLSSLHRKGIITVECVGIGVSKTPNKITINTSKFWEYDNINPTELLTGCTEYRIVTDKYKEKGYRVSYLQDNEEIEEGVTTGNIKEEKPQPSSSVIDKVIDDFVETITSAETIDDEYEEEIETADNVTKDLPKVNISIAPATATATPVTKPETKEGWFDLLVRSGYKIQNSDTPESFISKNFPLIEKMCNEKGLNNPELTYYDSEDLYKYCTSKRYI